MPLPSFWFCLHLACYFLLPWTEEKGFGLGSSPAVYHSSLFCFHASCCSHANLLPVEKNCCLPVLPSFIYMPCSTTYPEQTYIMDLACSEKKERKHVLLPTCPLTACRLFMPPPAGMNNLPMPYLLCTTCCHHFTASFIYGLASATDNLPAIFCHLPSQTKQGHTSPHYHLVLLFTRTILPFVTLMPSPYILYVGSFKPARAGQGQAEEGPACLPVLLFPAEKKGPVPVPSSLTWCLPPATACL